MTSKISLNVYVWRIADIWNILGGKISMHFICDYNKYFDLISSEKYSPDNYLMLDLWSSWKQIKNKLLKWGKTIESIQLECSMLTHLYRMQWNTRPWLANFIERLNGRPNPKVLINSKNQVNAIQKIICVPLAQVRSGLNGNRNGVV